MYTYLSSSLQFGQEGAGYLGNVLENNKILQQLIINNCGLGDSGVQHIAKGNNGNSIWNCIPLLFIPEISLWNNDIIINIIILIQVYVTTIHY